MTLGMWSGGVQHCAGATQTGRGCRNRGYTISRVNGYWCPHHRLSPTVSSMPKQDGETDRA